MQCPKCHHEAPWELLYSGEVLLGSDIIMLHDRGTFLCHECNYEEEQLAIPDGDYIHAIVHDLEGPEHCPTCHEPLREQYIPIAFTINESKEIDGITVVCPHCHDDISDSFFVSKITFPPLHFQEPQRCRICCCTYEYPCIDDAGNPCHWVEDDLCSACAGKQQAAENVAQPPSAVSPK